LILQSGNKNRSVFEIASDVLKESEGFGSLTLTNSQNRQKSFKYGFFYVKFLFFDVVCVVYL